MISLWDVLKASKGLPVSDLYAAMWGKQIAGKYTITELEGTLPMSIVSAGKPLMDYRIYGAEGGVGIETENLFNGVLSHTGMWNDSGTVVTREDKLFTEMIPVEPETTYTIRVKDTVEPPPFLLLTTYSVVMFDSDMQPITYIPAPFISFVCTFETEPGTAYIMASFSIGNKTAPISAEDIEYIDLVKSDEAPAEHIPYGYKLTMVSRSENLFDIKVEQGGWDSVNGGKPLKYGREKSNFYYIRCRCDSVYAVDPRKQYTISVFPKTFQISVKQTDLTGVQIADTGWGNDWTVTRASGVCFSIRNPTGSRIIPSDIQGVTIIEGSTAPTSYIPYYREETPIYIGDTQLMQDEYVSFSEGKIYKKVNSTLTPQDPPVPLPTIPTFNGSTTLDYDGTPAPEKVYIKYEEVKK